MNNKYGFLFWFFACVSVLPLLAQNQKLEEIRETLRFIRLAETKKNLSFDETKLLKINEILDEYEDQRLNLKAREQRIHRKLRFRNEEGRSGDDQALLDEIVAHKKAQMASDLDLLDRVQEVLTPSETIQFYMFYTKFQREIQKRIRMLQRDRNMPKRKMRRQ